MKPVDCYGLHWDSSVAWLVQGRGASNFAGVKAKAPFRASQGMCNHLVPAAAPVPDRVHWDILMKMFPDPLMQAMVPIPRARGENAFFIDDPYGDLGLYLTTLSRLSSPIRKIVRPAATVKAKDLENELSASNIQPMILTKVTQENQTLVDLLGKLVQHAPRTVILAGEPEVAARPPFQRIQTDIRRFALDDLIPLPFETLGATLIRRYARGEQLDAPMESRDQRRERMIRERNRP